MTLDHCIACDSWSSSVAEESCEQQTGEPDAIERLALPYDNDLVARCTQRSGDPLVASAIGIEFRGPELPITPRKACAVTPVMAVPEATMDEYDPTPTAIREVGTAR